jgi:hypothetical protein
MTPREGVVLASRSLSLLFMVWAFSELTALPGHLYSFLRYADPVVTMASSDHWRHYYLMMLAFNLTRIVGFGLLAMWLREGGPEVAELLLPAAQVEDSH